MIIKIKQLLERFKDWIIISILGIGVVLAAGSQVIPLPPIPVDLQLKCDKADILETYQKDNFIEYAYKTNIKIPKLSNEIKRTNTTLTKLERDKVYKVKEGETLDKIAEKLNIDKKKIKGYKSGNPDIIYTDEVIDLGSKQYSVESGHSQYFDGIDWYEAKFATTTLEMYNRQMISLAERVFAADTGWEFPSSYDGKYNSDYWHDKANVYGAGVAYAHQHTAASQDQSWENFGFSITEGATIDGIEFKVYSKRWSGISANVQMAVWDGAAWQIKTCHALTDDYAWYTDGGASDLWGGSWTDSDFSNANFSVYLDALYSANGVVYVDELQVKVYYTESARRIIITQ